MEAHEDILLCIIELALDLLVVDVCRNGIVDIKQCNSIIADNGTDELAECSVDIYLTGYRNASLGKTAVNVARYASELCLECRPALSCQCNELTISSVLLDPVKKSDLVLCKLV